MSTKLSESEYNKLSNSNKMDLIEITTNEKNTYKITLTEPIGGSWKGIGYNINSTEENRSIFNFTLRYGKGVDGNNDEPFIALSMSPEVETNKIKKYLVTSANKEIDDFILNEERGSAKYDEYVTSLRHFGKQKLKIG